MAVETPEQAAPAKPDRDPVGEPPFLRRGDHIPDGGDPAVSLRLLLVQALQSRYITPEQGEEAMRFIDAAEAHVPRLRRSDHAIPMLRGLLAQALEGRLISRDQGAIVMRFIDDAERSIPDSQK
jgi:hypothetical protein